MNHSRIYLWLCGVIYRMWTFGAWQQAQATGRLQCTEHQVSPQTGPIDLLTAQPIPTAGAPATVPLPETRARDQGRDLIITHELRKYCNPLDTTPGTRMRAYQRLMRRMGR